MKTTLIQQKPIIILSSHAFDFQCIEDHQPDLTSNVCYTVRGNNNLLGSWFMVNAMVLSRKLY